MFIQRPPRDVVNGFIYNSQMLNKCPSRGEETAQPIPHNGLLPSTEKEGNPIPPRQMPKTLCQVRGVQHTEYTYKIPHNENSSKWELSL